jgi:hypothetical protein
VLLYRQVEAQQQLLACLLLLMHRTRLDGAAFGHCKCGSRFAFEAARASSSCCVLSSVIQMSAFAASLDNTDRTVGCDVCIVMDTTGGPRWLNEAKSHVNSLGPEIHEELAKLNPGREVVVNLGFVSQKDFGRTGPSAPDAGHLQFEALTDDCAKLVETIRSVTASGGSDLCEDVAGALSLASGMRMGWSKSNKCIIHFLDAPPHGKEYHNLGTSGDNHLEIGTGLTDTLRGMAQYGIHYTMVQCVFADDPKLDKFAKVCERVYAENAAAMEGQAGIIPKFTPLSIDPTDHKRFFELVIASTMRTMNPSTPSKIFDKANQQAVTRLASVAEE